MNVNVNLLVENITQIKSSVTINADVSVKIRRNVCEKKIIWNASTCTCENGKYSGSIIRDSVVTCDKVIEVSKIIPTKANPTKTLSNF